jgi:hypothetical protein
LFSSLNSQSSLHAQGGGGGGGRRRRRRPQPLSFIFPRH